MDDINVLTALERRPLTVENLSYSLGWSLEETREIVQRLWNEDYIDTTTSASSGATIGAITSGAILGMVVGGPIGAAVGAGLIAGLGNKLLFGGNRKQRIPSDSKTYFTITSKGHYRLHPPISNNS